MAPTIFQETDFTQLYGLNSREQLEEVLNRQDFKKQKMLLGKRLVQLGYCTEDDVSRVIAKRAGIPFVSLENYSIDAAAVSTVPPDAIKRYKALPVGFDQDKLVVAIQHPNNIVALDDLRILTGYEIKPVVVPDSELEVAIEKYTRKEAAAASNKRITRAIKDIRIFVNTIKQAIEIMRKSGINAKAAQIDRGEYIEFVVRVPKN